MPPRCSASRHRRHRQRPQPSRNCVDAADGQSRFDADHCSRAKATPASGVPYQVQYALRRGDAKIWLEDTGRWFAGADGKPLRAHGIVRVINERHEREAQACCSSRKFDALTGEMNRAHLTEVLGATLDEAMRFRASCGFLLVAIDHLGRLNEAYGFDVADEVIAQVAKRIRARLRGKDYLGRFSGNKFGVMLTSLHADELTIAAERLLAGVRDETIATSAGPVAVTVTIGGVTAPRHARTVPEILSRAQDALARRARQAARLVRRLSAERRARRAAPRQRARHRRDRDRAQRAAHRAGLRAGGRRAKPQGRVLRMPDARPARRRRASPTPTRSSRWPSGSVWCACSIIACSNWW